MGVKVKENINYAEPFDMERIADIADMSMRDAVETICGKYLKVTGMRCPNGDYSDMECNIWSLMNRLIFFGMELKDLELKERILDKNGLVDAVEDFKFMNPITRDIHMRE